MRAPRALTQGAVLALFLATGVYGAWIGGQATRIADDLGFAADRLARSAGFGISSITISGLGELQEWQVLEALDIDDTRALPSFDAGEAREKLQAVPWIRDASVLKLYPGALKVSIVERTPYALWQKGGRFFVIDRDGRVLEPFDEPRFAGLPLVVGEGAAEAAPQLFAALDRSPELKTRLRAAIRVAERRWTLKLHDGPDVQLPERGFEAAIGDLAALDRRSGLLDRDIVGVDLRWSDRLVVRVSDAGAERWREAAQARERRLREVKS